MRQSIKNIIENSKQSNPNLFKGSSMTRAQHLEWCKKRAHEYLARGDVQNAVVSMMSDMQKHKETEYKNPAIDMIGMLAVQNNSVSEARRFIDGFN